MHIAEGYLPPLHAAAWGVAAAPFVVYGARAVVKQVREDPETKLLLGAAGAFCFVLSALKLPSVTGSCSHPTGTGFGAVLFRPPVMALLGTIVLFFQATLLAHGGLTTLGANVFSMAIAGPWVAYGVYVLTRRLGGGLLLGVFLAAALGDLATYCVTSVQLALAFPDAVSGVPGAIAKFGSIFAITQIPLAVSEGLLTVLIVRLLTRVSPAELGRLGLLGRNPEGGDGVKRSTLINWLLVAAVVVIAAVPLLFVDGEYGGADSIAAERIAADHPDYVPWASALFEPSEEVASGLFAAQAAIGAGFLGYYFGAARTRRKLAGPSGSGTPDPTS